MKLNKSLTHIFATVAILLLLLSNEWAVAQQSCGQILNAQDALDITTPLPRLDPHQDLTVFHLIQDLNRLFQTDFTMTPKEFERIKIQVDRLSFSDDLKSPEAERWVEENGKKLIQQALDMEKVWDILEELGLRQKLLALYGNTQSIGSMAWWMNKEPLRSRPLGREGVTAKELGLVLVSHETGDLAAYKSILRPPSGKPNALVSRRRFPGEMAKIFDGFYTCAGDRRGRGGDGKVVYMRVNPNAREGSDFILTMNAVIWLNRNALTLIPEGQVLPPQGPLRR